MLRRIEAGSANLRLSEKKEEALELIFSGTEWISRDELVKRTDGERISEDMVGYPCDQI